MLNSRTFTIFIIFIYENVTRKTIYPQQLVWSVQATFCAKLTFYALHTNGPNKFNFCEIKIKKNSCVTAKQIFGSLISSSIKITLVKAKFTPRLVVLLWILCVNFAVQFMPSIFEKNTLSRILFKCGVDILTGKIIFRGRMHLINRNDK